MKVKLSQIVNSIEQFKSLQQIKLPIKIAYKIARLVNKLQPEIDTFDKKRNELIMELGTKNEDETTSVKPDKLKEFTEKYNELLDIDVEIDWFTPIKIEELGDISIEVKNLPDWIFID